MHTVGILEVQAKLAALLDEVEDGGEVTITRHGRPVARIVPVAPSFDREKARLAVEGLKALSKGLRLDGLTIRDLITEGRR